MTSIPTFLPGGVFEPHDIRAMSVALDEVCKTLNLNEAAKAAGQVVAERIITLVQEGERNPIRLREKILQECGFSEQEPDISRRWSGL